MKKNIPLYILLVFLIIVNAFFLFNYLGKSNHKGKRGNQNNFIVRELKFDDTQKQKLKDLEASHHKRIRTILEGSKELKGELFDKISMESISESEIDSIASLIGDIEKDKELETFYHFRAIQNICNDEQKEAFERIVKKALHRKGRNGSPHGKRRDGDRPPRH
nr:hypothetical protein [uncultured Psychroserpens sp.]